MDIRERNKNKNKAKRRRIMAETSAQAYARLKPDLTKRQQQVFHGLCNTYEQLKRPACDMEVAAEMGWPINRVSGRIFDLLNKHAAKIMYKKKAYGRNRRFVAPILKGQQSLF